MSNIAVTLVPIGRRSDGSTGFALDGSDIPIASIIEVQSTLPDVSDPNNYVGRVVFSIANSNVYVFTDTPSDQWIELKNNAVVDVQAPAPTTPGVTGEFYYSTTYDTLYLFVDPEWIPVGGSRGSTVIWRYYTGDGSTSLFDTGASTNPPVDYVQVFIDGLGKRPGTSAPTRDFYMVGNSVQMNAVPANGTLIAIRTVTFMTVARNSNFIVNRYVADGTANSYDSGIIQASIGQVFVSIDGVMQTPDTGAGDGTYDYRISTQNTRISSMTAVGTTVSVTTEEAHGFIVGNTIKIYGAQQTQYNGTFTVATAPTSTTLTYTASSAPVSSPATPYPVLYFGPVSRNDKVIFVDTNGDDSPLPAGAVVTIRAVENIISTATAGATDTQPITSVVESGLGVGVYKDKSGSQLTLKTLVAGNNMTITEGTDDVTLTARHNHVWNYVTFNGVPSTYVVGEYDTYIAVKNASSGAVTVDLSTFAPDPALTGRFVLIKDAAFNAGTHNISIQPHSTSRIELEDGSAFGTTGSPFVMNTDGELVALMFNGNDWEMSFRHPGVTGSSGPPGPAGPEGDPGTDAFVTRVSIDGTTDPYVMPVGVSYIGVNNTSGSSVTVDVFTNVDSVDDVGRRIVIKDETGNAGTHNILIDPGGSRSIDGASAGTVLTLSTNYASATLVFNGTKYLTI